jgi:hypothetical protein
MKCRISALEFTVFSYRAKFIFLRFFALLSLRPCSILVLAYFMQDIPAPKTARRAVGTVCEACGKHFAASDGFDKHRTSGYLLGTPSAMLQKLKCFDEPVVLF